ncbi:MAG: hypothetical protein WBQ95_21400 [Terracidiphilus sp.]
MKLLTALRRVTILLAFLLSAVPDLAQVSVTIAQLLQFLKSKQAAKESDADLADRLSSVSLSEQLTSATLSRLLTETSIGPKASEQLQLLAFASVFFPPPRAEVPDVPPPDSAARQRVLFAAVSYVNTTLQLLPDFLATRTTLSFENTLVQTGPRPKATLHLVRGSHREIAYRNGREVADTASTDSGLNTWGEFGPILKTVLADSFMGNVEWARWQTSQTGALLAVFRFTVPQSASHYLIDFCCYQKSEDDPVQYSFHAKPGYRGEIYLDPATGVIDRITLHAELADADPVAISEIAVQYGYVDIGGKSYVCPIQGIAVTEVHNLRMESVDGVGLEKHINIVHFLNYHKFGSTSRILPK